MEIINIKTTDQVMGEAVLGRAGGGETASLQLRTISYHCDDAYCYASLCSE